MSEDKKKEEYATLQARHFRQCSREAKWVALVWLVGLIYCSVVISLFGYIPPEERPDEPSLTLGMPSWVFWGLFIPWFVQIGITLCFAFWVIKDDEPLPEGEAGEESGE